MSEGAQIFQTANPKRWRNFKWSLRILLMIIVFFLVVLAVAIVSGTNPSIPNLEAKSKAYQQKLDPTNPLTLSQRFNKKYKGFKDFLDKKIKEDSLKTLKLRNTKALPIPNIRAAFYTPWTGNTSLPDLEKYGSNLNVIFPEWFFIDTVTHRLQTRIDSAGLALMQQKKLRIMPMLSNFNSSLKDFDGHLLHDILNNETKRKAFITQVVDTLVHYHLNGINVDFEELKETTNAPLTAFQKELYETLHSKGMTITMDVAVDNDDYDYSKLSAYNDYIVLMAYDQFNDGTIAGPVSAQKWIEGAVDRAAKKIEPGKIILGIAGYGRDWYKTSEGKDTCVNVSYNDAINKAKIKNVKIDFDNDSYNLHYNYTDEEKLPDGDTEIVNHEIWCTDAATTFNVLRFSDEYQTAGTALWRMGSEDARMWSFYSRDLSTNALAAHPFDFNSIATIPIIPDNVGYDGEGEVLNIIASPQEGKIKIEIDSAELLIAEQDYQQLPSGYIIQKFAEDKTEPGPGHKLILTFDDGPDAEWTPQVLDILEKEKVPATFFVVGLQAEKNIPLLQRINKLGFEIGNHTFTHSNVAKMSTQRAGLEMKLTRLLIESVTGRSTILFRAPYNADSEPHTYEELEPIERSRQENYLTIGESIDPNDWQVGVTADSIVARTINQVEERGASIILLHDAGGITRQATIDALPKIIDYFKKRGYKFTSVADLMGKTRDEIMPKIPPSKDGWLTKVNFFFAESTYWGSHVVFALFIVGILLSVGRMVVMAILAWRQKNRESKQAVVAAATTYHQPLVSIIVPAYNEEINAVRTIKSLLQQDYPNLEVVFVDDGSKDSTYDTVSNAFANHPGVFVYTKPNGGKASALNFGIEKANSDYVVCIDADTQLKPNAVTELMKKFYSTSSSKVSPASGSLEGAVGAVAGNVKVGNEVNMITRWQSIEYITSQNFDRRAFDLLNCITVVPGAIGAFKKEAVIKAGGFTTDTLAEDCDLTMRLHRNGYMVRNCNEAVSYTEAPETMKQFMKQRFRWSFGVMQCFWKHRDAVFNPRYKNFGMVALPNILIFQIILPFLAPLADLVLLLSLLAAGLGIIPADISHIVLYYLIFTMVDVAGAALAFAFEKEDYKKLIWMIPQRLVYRQLMYYILIKSFNKAIKGELQGWGVLKRTGNVKQLTPV
jgi:cellulose synthase/poly-beta-1,6-N-acetylglucosamine synthase-like glycosyltransferase/spore germination protein YaaH/peptidoglycan/xylan/chitin deacetylase (PgdA/CDA1 family)